MFLVSVFFSTLVTDQPHNEFRLKRSSTILAYIKNFSATEKALFCILVIVMLVSTSAMFVQANNHFMTEIPAAGGTLREGLVGLPRTVNPILAITDVDRDISSLIYAGLMKYEGGALVPDLAESYTLSDDGLTYIFTLRSDTRFHDNTPLTADDILFTIQKIQDENLKSPRRADWVNVTVSKTSEGKIQFSLKQPYSPFLTNTTIGIIPKHIWGPLSDTEFVLSKHNIEPIGAGPYKLTDISKDSGSIPTQYTLSTWRNYHGTTPHLSTLIFNFFSDETRALSALENGTIDSLPAISPMAAADLSAHATEQYTVLSEPLPRIFGVFFNQNQSALLSDKIVRTALDMSVDRNAIVDSILFGYGVPIHGPLPAGTSTPQQSTSTTSDMIPAMELLEDNGWKKNSDGIYEKSTKTSTQKLAFTLYTADTPDLTRTAEILKTTWEQLGAQVEVKVFESSDLYQNIIKTRKYDALLFGEQIGKDRDLYAFWHSSQRNAPGLNVAMYTNSKADKILEDLRATNSSTVRTEKYAELDQIIRNDIPALFLYSPDFIYAVPKTIQDIELGSITTPSDRFNSIGSWYAVTEKVWTFFAKNNTN